MAFYRGKCWWTRWDLDGFWGYPGIGWLVFLTPKWRFFHRENGWKLWLTNGYTWIPGWWFQTWLYYVPFHIYGMSSFPLTNSYFSMCLKPPTSNQIHYFQTNPYPAEKWQLTGESTNHQASHSPPYAKRKLFRTKLFVLDFTILESAEVIVILKRWNSKSQ